MAFLSDFTIYSSSKSKLISRVENVLTNKTGAQRGIVVKRLAETPLGNWSSFIGITLPIASRDIIAYGVCGDVF